ncbi:MAG: glycosylhydrolase-like jelly roll fold domain-containing protein [Thermoguttaceae bacterium]
MKTLSVDYTIDGHPRNATVLDGQTITLGDVIDPMPIADVKTAADGNFSLEAWQNGRYELKTASGRTLQCNVDYIPAAHTIDGPWELRFPANPTQQSRLSLRESGATFAERKATITSGGAPASVTLDKLISWSEHPNAGVKYFSGTAVYRKTFDLPPDALAAGRAIYLDLGRVAVIARVSVNGQDLGIFWNAPFRIEATKALRSGENVLEVQVTNLWANRMIGDEQLPEDSERNPDGSLHSWPKWLLEGKPSPAGRHTFATYRIWRKDSPLQESGLLGPVKFYTTRQVAVER